MTDLPSGISPKEGQILEAAVRVFALRGYHGSTMAEVAADAGVATGTIYLYFHRKQELLISLFQRHLGNYMSEMRPRVMAAAAGTPRLKALVESHLAFFAEDRALASVFQVHARDPDPELAEGIRPSVAQYFDIIGEVMESGVEAGAFRADLSVRLARQVFFGALDEVVTGWLRSTHPYSLMSALEPVTVMLSGAFGATPSSPGESP